MKRMITVFLILLLLCASVACNEKNDNNNLAFRNESINIFSSGIVSNVHTGKKVDFKNVKYASPYSEGCIFLELENGETYCTDINGNVIFKADDRITNIGYSKFYNGYAFVLISAQDGSGNNSVAICDKTGKLITPSDVGVTEFHRLDETLRAGYILATRIDSNYSATRAQLGVLDTKFKWSVPLSESLYSEFGDDLYDSYNENFVVNNCYYFNELAKSLNLKTGEVRTADLRAVTPSYKWGVDGKCGAYYRVRRGVVVPEDGMYIDLHDNAIGASTFCNGVAGVLYHNESAGRYYITMINEKGVHLFEPVVLNTLTYGFEIATDGNYLVYIDGNSLVCLDRSGKKVGECEISSKTMSKSLEISDGVVSLDCYVSGKSKRVYYYAPQSKKLF